MVETALVLPGMLLLLLLTIQLTQLQRARILADYAAFAAARAGIVLDGDPSRMQEAAALAVLPSLAPAGDLAGLVKARARLLAQDAALRPLGLEQVRVVVHNPVAADFETWGRHLDGQEIDFDDVRPGAAEATLLSLEVRYLYELRVPFANQAIQSLWLAARAFLPTAASEATPVAGLAAAARAGRFYLPVEAFYTMRMQSNPFRKWAHP